MKYISLFCGCGGFDVGLKKAGFIPSAAFDIDPVVLKAFHTNVGPEACLRDLSSGLEKHEVEKGIGLVVAGPPCQGFSTVGKRNFNDPRNNLLAIAGEIAVKLRPKVFVLENVRGVTAGSHKIYWESLISLLKDAEYQVAAIRCDGPDFGLAQLRSRMILLAWRVNKDTRIEFDKKKGLTLRDVLHDLDTQQNHVKKFLLPDSSSFRIAGRIAPGQKLCDVRGGVNSVHTWDIPEVFGEVASAERRLLEFLLKVRRTRRIRITGDADPVPREVVNAAFGGDATLIVDSLIKKGYLKIKDGNLDLGHGFNGKFRRLCWDKPSFTVDTRFGNPKYFLHPEESRGFTVREAARIQGFPDDFVFTGTESQQFRMVGNAVPPPLAETLGEFIKENFFK